MAPEDMVIKLSEIEHRSKSNTRRVEKLELQTEAIQSLATSVEILVKEQGHQTKAMSRIEQNVKELDGKVEALEKKPGKRWENIADKVLWALIAAALGFILARIGIA